jgi:ATP-dependent helicase/nuclease subunit B
MNLFDIPAHRPFLDTLAAGVLRRAAGDGPEALARTTILLPTRRSARALREAFLRAGDGRALLLPRMRALAGLSTEDADELALPALLAIPPAVDPLRRQAVLTALVQRRPPRHGGPATLDQAWVLGAELARLFDEIALEEPDAALLARPPEDFAETWLTRLKDLVPEAHARHWEITLIFLRGIVEEWNAWLQEAGLLDIGVRRAKALEAQAEAWRTAPPADPVIAAGIGIGGTLPVAARLLAVIARLPQGAVVLHGLDRSSREALRDAIAAAPTHPFAGQVRLLDTIGATQDDVAPWVKDIPTAVPERRAALIGMALRPPAGMQDWTRRAPAQWQDGLVGLSLLTAPDAGAEAAAVALLLRETLETPGARAALVTPDRELARRVSAELARFGVTADDSAGEPLGETPAGAFLRLLAHCIAEDFAPVPLLALVKHPLAAGGLDRAAWLSAWRLLERRALRGPRPAPGLAGLRAAIAASFAHERDAEALARIHATLDAFAAALGDAATPGTGPRPAADLLAAQMTAAEALAATPEAAGGLRLYAGAEGEPLALHLASLADALPALPPMPPRDWPAFLDTALADGVARSARASRGRDGSPHPRVEILGLLEARLLAFDRVILGALDETVWPLATDPGPWMSRPMRRDFGLPESEARIGRVAADFLLTACAAPDAILTRSAKRGGSPTVPARWLVRLETFLQGQTLALPASPAAAWAAELDQPDRITPCTRPAPNPPLAARPERISLSDIALLLADPYALYAKRVLRLAPLAPLDASIGAPEYGELVHEAMARFIRALDTQPWPGEDAARTLFATAMEEALALHGPRPAYAAFWRPRLARIGAFAIAQEATPRGQGRIARSHVETTAQLPLATLGPRAIQITARADRIDTLTDGSLAILDYKTGALPKREDCETGLAPQLPLEAWMALEGAFANLPPAPVATLDYWRLSGGDVAGQALRITEDETTTARLAEGNREAAAALATRFLLTETPFTARPHPLRAPRGGDYDHLSRLAEWAGAEEEAP